MGNRCFRPDLENNSPVYVSSLSSAIEQAKRVYLQKKSEKQIIIEEIVKNEQRKGNLKKLFDHLNSHQRNILPSIKQCNKKISFQKSSPAVIIASMYSQQLLKLLSNKKLKFQTITTQENLNNMMVSRKNLNKNEFNFRNMIHQIEPHFFQLVIKILVYNKEKIIQNSISQTLIKYSQISQEKISARKQLKNLLDLYLTIIFEKDIQMINKHSFQPFYAYSALLSKSKSQLFTADFIQKHFNFILKIFFELQDTKASSKSLIQTEEFGTFEDCVLAIVREFVLFSTENKKIKQHILNEIMLEEDCQKFETVKTIKFEKIIKENLNSYNREHFMFDWLGLLVKYIGKNVQNDNQSLRDSLKESIQQLQLHSTHSMKNFNSTQSKVNAVLTLKRWFQEQLLNTQKTLEYFSSRIFQALLINLYSPQGNNQDLSLTSQEVLNYVLNRKPQKLSEIFLLLNKQLRKNKNQYFYADHHQLSTSLPGIKRKLGIIEQEAAETLWKNDITFIMKGLKIDDKKIGLNGDQIIEIYQPVPKQSRLSINLLYLIQLSGIGLKYIKLSDQKNQNCLYNFLISLTNTMKIQNSEMDFEYMEKLIEKMKFLFTQIYTRSEPILFSFLKHNFKNIFKEDLEEQLWTEILIMIIVINIVIEQKKKGATKRKKQLEKFLNKITDIIKRENSKSKKIYQTYVEYKELFDFSQRVSAHLQKIKIRTIDQLQNKFVNENYQKSLSYVQDSVISSKLQVSSTNPDNDLKNIIGIIVTK